MSDDDIERAYQLAIRMMLASSGDDSHEIKWRALCAFVAGVCLARGGSNPSKARKVLKSLAAEVPAEIDSMYENSSGMNLHTAPDRPQ